MGTFLLISLLIVAVLLILVILLQKGRGGGLGAAFGAGAGSAFGTKTGDVLTWVTIALTILFLGLTLLSVVAVKPDKSPAEMPVFSPENPISERTIVQITCPTPKATIHFTTDSTTPTENSPKYTNSTVRVRPGQTLKAIAVATGMLPSPVKSFTYLTPEEAAKLAAEKAKEAPTTLPAATTMPATTQPAGSK